MKGRDNPECLRGDRMEKVWLDNGMRDQLHRFYDLLGEGICIVLADGSERVVFVSSQTAQLYECTSEDEFLAYCGGSYQNMMNTSDYVSLEKTMSAGADFGHLSFHYLTKNGKYRKAEGFSRLKDTPFGKAYIVELFSADLVAEERKSDGITNLPGTHDFYKQALETAKHKMADGSLKEFCPVYFDITHFREYNRLNGTHRGDRCLKKIAESIRKAYPEELAGHLTADQFVAFLPEKGLEKKLASICDEVNRFIDDNGIQIKAGICRNVEQVTENGIRHAFVLAKMACESIKQDGSRFVAVYDSSLGELNNRKMYILRNFNEALQNHYIKLYLQPVVRTLTGSLCGFEALARWEDPAMGMIPPGVFIPVLEEFNLIGRLDRYMLERVLGLLRDRMDNGLQMIPVSVNLSGRDFDAEDFFYSINKIVDRYHVPHSVLHFEITERVMVHNRNGLVSIIDQFQKAGYQIWMDDFGSEYSSLNSLHYYHFDEIKIDMGFFSHFDDRSRQIITSVVVMAKMLGVRTLAEGVETEDQIAFLKKIGCGRIQGFCYGKPMSYENCLAYIHENNLNIESQEENSLFDSVESVNVISDLPIALFMFEGQEITFLLENDAYHRERRSTGAQNLYQGKVNLYDLDFPFRGRFFSIFTKAFTTRREENMFYVDNGQYLKASVRWISGGEQKWIGEIRLYNISSKSEIQNEKVLDNFLRNMFHVYDGLYVLDRGKNEVRVLQCVHPREYIGESFQMIMPSFRNFALEYIHPDDQKRFMEFIRPENLESETIRAGGRGVSEIVRVRREDGMYRWTIFEALVIDKSRTKNILLCEREDIWERKRDRKALLPEFCRSFGVETSGSRTGEQPEKVLFDKLLGFSPYPFFWKDRNGRILGSSAALCKMAGIPDARSLIGKTEEELGWLLDPSTLKNTECKVLGEGESQALTTEQVLADGHFQKISITWTPYYQGNELAGALGMLGSDDGFERKEADRLGLTDPETGLQSFRGAIESGLLYFNQYRLKKTDYVGLLIDVAAFSSVQTEFQGSAGTVLKEIVQALREVLVPGWTIARIGTGRFLCFSRREREMDIAGLTSKLALKFREIWIKQGIHTDPQMTAASVFGSETKSLDDLLQLLFRRLSSVESQYYGDSAYTGDRVIVRKETFDNLPENIVIIDPKTYELVYLNASARKANGIALDKSLQGMHCYEVLEGLNGPCRDCPNVLLRQDRFFVMAHTCHKNGETLLVRSCLIRWEDRVLQFTFAIHPDEYINKMTKDQELIYQEVKANEAISIGLSEEDPDRGITKMVESISKNLQPERFLIFEERSDNTVSAAYEWTAPGVLPLKDELQSIPKTGLRALYQEFTQHHVVMVSDVEAFRKEHPDFRFRLYGVKSFVSGQLVLPDRTVGFTMVVNPSNETFRQASLLLDTLTDFIAIMIRNRNSMRRLKEQSMKDQLTGIRNRRGFVQQVQEWKDLRPLGIISVDLNGLKRTNDARGHSAGDTLIRETARILSDCAGKECVFRIGGDEFVVLTEEMDDKDIQLLIHHIRDTAQESGISLALGYALSEDENANIDTLLTCADRKMYEDKAHNLHRRRDD